MQIGFATNELCQLCNSSRRLIKSLGIETGERVMDLLHFLDAAPTLADLSTSPPILRKKRKGFRPAHYSVGREGDGQVLLVPKTPASDLAKVESVSIISVGGRV